MFSLSNLSRPYSGATLGRAVVRESCGEHGYGVPRCPRERFMGERSCGSD